MKLVMDDGQEFAISAVREADLIDGCILVFETKNYLSQESCARFQDSVKRIFGRAVKAFVLEGGVELSILRDLKKR
jgi:hypothetical protein